MQDMNRGVEYREVVLLGIPFHDVTMAETLQHIDLMVAARRPGYLATANLDFATQAGSDVELQRILFEADLVLCDGTPLIWASRWLGASLRERVAGSDLLPELFAHSEEKGHRIFFLGSSDEVLEEAVARCREAWPALTICGTYSPPYAKLLELDEAEIGQKVREASPDILLVAMGCPKQEKWIYKNFRGLGVPVSIGIGASLDFIAGKFKRAPLWMRVCGLEWVFRLLQEPRRLFSRYWLDLVFFVRTFYAQKRLLKDNGGGMKSPGENPVKAGEGFVVHCWTGRVDAAAVADAKVEPVRAEAGRPNVIIDCSGVTFMDSTGLALLIKSYRNCKDSGGTMLVRSPCEQVRGLLMAMKLDRLIPVVDSEEEVRKISKSGAVHGSVPWKYDTETKTLTIRITGDITAASVTDCQALLDRAWEQGFDVQQLHADLGGVLFIDSSGLGFLIKVRKRMLNQKDGAFLLMNVTPNVRNVIRLAKLEVFLGLPNS